MGSVIDVLVGAAVIREDAWSGAGRIALIMVRRPADTRELHKQGALHHLAHPWRSGPVSRSEPEISARRIVAIALEMAPVLLGICEAWTGLEQKNIETTGCEFLRNDGSAAARSDHNDVAHAAPCNRVPEVTSGIASPGSIPEIRLCRQICPGNWKAANQADCQ